MRKHFRKLRRRRPRLTIGVATIPFLAALVLAACGGSSSGDKISLVAYSTPQSVYEDDLIPGFQKTSEGKNTDFSTSFGPSGDQSRAVESGLDADVVHFSLSSDITRDVDAGKIADDWDQNQYKGIVEDSVVVFVTRKGEPTYKTWDDLVQGDTEIITPNPFQSGGARWNLMAAYGAEIHSGKSPAEALDFLKQILEHTPVQDASARDALATFTGGKGDVLLAYENEAIAAQDAGEDVEYTIPDDTILIQTPIATTTEASTQAQDFVDYLYTPEAQQLWADAGYRSVVKSVFDKNKDKFPTPSDLFTIDEFGGWDKVSTEFFDPENGKVAAIEKDLGVATE
jgi:sulfate/thiosulfate transport system substrate-binding protein